MNLQWILGVLFGFCLRGILDRQSKWFRKFWYGTGERKDAEK